MPTVFVGQVVDVHGWGTASDPLAHVLAPAHDALGLPSPPRRAEVVRILRAGHAARRSRVFPRRSSAIPEQVSGEFWQRAHSKASWRRRWQSSHVSPSPRLPQISQRCARGPSPRTNKWCGNDWSTWPAVPVTRVSRGGWTVSVFMRTLPARICSVHKSLSCTDYSKRSALIQLGAFASGMLLHPDAKAFAT